MKKYRFNDPSTRTPFQKVRPFLALFVGWNVCGYLLYKFVINRAARKDPDWDKKSQGEKIAIAMGATPGAIEKKKYSLFKTTVTESEDKS